MRAKVRLARDNPIFSVPAFVGMRGSAVQRRPSTIRRHDHYIPPPHALVPTARVSGATIARTHPESARTQPPPPSWTAVANAGWSQERMRLSTPALPPPTYLRAYPPRPALILVHVQRLRVGMERVGSGRVRRISKSRGPRPVALARSGPSKAPLLMNDAAIVSGSGRIFPLKVGVGPFKAPEPLPAIISSYFPQKNGFPTVKGLSQVELS